MNYKSTSKVLEIGNKAFAGSLSVTGDATISGNVVPTSESEGTLGTDEKPWEAVHTKELNLTNDNGDWTVIQEENYLTVRNNKTNKLYKLLMQEIE